jgi:hypothetical protein
MYIDSLIFCGVSYVYYVMQQQPLMGQGLLIFEASRSHSDTRHSIGLLWTSGGPSQRPLPGNTQHSQERDLQALNGVRNRNPSKRATVDPRLREHGHRTQLSCLVYRNVQHNTRKLFKVSWFL